ERPGSPAGLSGPLGAQAPQSGAAGVERIGFGLAIADQRQKSGVYQAAALTLDRPAATCATKTECTAAEVRQIVIGQRMSQCVWYRRSRHCLSRAITRGVRGAALARSIESGSDSGRRGHELSYEKDAGVEARLSTAMST